ncbi:MAG TPA: peptidoglycan-binding protein [Gaiellaceae bacterium]|jgi:murein L,D-transpeptidase YcbB/YkuD|nr:peptidoglycan-binding protein [Gaiellaceae bacterium]
MADRDTRSPDPDDWFAEPDRAPPPRRVRLGERPAAPSPVEADEDDWVAGTRTRRSRAQRPAFASSLPDRWVPIAAGAVLVLVLLIGGLAVAGVFSSSKPTQAATTHQITSTPTTTTRTRRTTTAAVTSVPAPTTTLKPGDTGAQVKVLQRALAGLGYSVGTIDGDYGTSTKTAVAQFQTAQNLTSDGVFGQATRTALIKALKSG